MKTVRSSHFKIEQIGSLSQHTFTLRLQLNGRSAPSNTRQCGRNNGQNKISYRHAFIDYLRLGSKLYSSDYFSIRFSDIKFIGIRKVRRFVRCRVAFVITIYAYFMNIVIFNCSPCQNEAAQRVAGRAQ